MPNAYPSKDPASEGKMSGTMEQVYRKLSEKEFGQLPARVVEYDRVNNVARVLPLIMVWHTDGNTTLRAEIAEVPVLALGGGGMVVTFDLQPGDLGWIEASSRDISLFMQSLDAARPATVRLNDLADARFVPDVYRRYTLAQEAEGHMLIQSTDGQTYLAIGKDHIAIKAFAGRLDIQTPDVNIQADNVSLQAEQVRLQATNVAMAAQVDVTGGLSINGVELRAHTHTSSIPGTQTSGPRSGA